MRIETILGKRCQFKGFVIEKCRMAEKDRLTFDVRERKGSMAVCSGCGQNAPGYDRLPPRRFEFIPLWGMAVLFLYSMRRVACPDCGIVVEKVPWSDGKSPQTIHFQVFLADWAKLLSWKTVAEKFRTSWDIVRRAVETVVAYGLANRRLDGVSAIGVDEIQYRKGHKYLTLVYQLDSGTRRLLWVGKDRTAECFRSFFDGMEKAHEGFCAGIGFLCSDMWKAYLRVAKERLPDVVHILDRFHVMGKFGKAIDKIRAEEARRLRKEGKAPVLKHSRWCFPKRPANLTDKERFKLKDLLKMNIGIVRAYLLKEQFQFFWEYKSPAWAGKFLDTWCCKAARSRLRPMKDVAKTLVNHRELLLNWFRAKKQYNSGIVEGLNYKVNTLVRKAFGYRSFEIIETALYHQLGDLPEPDFENRFW
jgi:transposase